MSDGKELWDKYCSFYEKDFSEQLEYNGTHMRSYFEKWKHTKLAKILNSENAKTLDEVPVTDYGDYPILGEFGERIEYLTNTHPRHEGELLWDYYTRISREAAPMVRDYMVDTFSFCAKTSGTSGTNKWVTQGEEFWKNLEQDAIAAVVFSCSDEWGSSRARVGDRGLNVVAPAPYMSGWGFKACQAVFRTVPPVEVTDNEPDMRKKFYIAFKAIEEGERIELAGGVGSLLYMICEYFLEPDRFYREFYESLNFSLVKVGLLLKWLQTEISGKRIRDIRELMPLKGITLVGVDARLYADFFKEKFGLDVFGVYGSTELGEIMWGQPDRKGDLTPNLRSSYWEFQTDGGEIRKVDELKSGKVYSVIGIPFGSIFMRYKIGDLVRVIDFRDDGMPIFSFEGRTMAFVDIYGYCRLTEDIASRALAKAGLRLSDRWAITKIVEPREHLHVLMEREWDLSAEEASEALFYSLQQVCEDFRKYVRDFGIKKPSEAITVEYLKRGAFLRYSAIQAKKGVPIGQYKPPKVIPPEKHDVYETLKVS
jgi:hypothetical protein